MAGTSRTKAELASTLDLSLSSVSRHIREIESLQLAERTPDDYILTAAGRLAVEEYDRFEERLANFDRLASALSALPPGTPLDPSLLTSEVVLADRTLPHQPIDAYASILEQARHVRAVIPVVVPRLVELYHRRIIEEGMTAELVLTEPVLERLIAAHTEEFRRALDTGRLSIRQTDSAAYGLSIVETEAGLSANFLPFVETGLHALVKSVDPAAIQWAEVVYEQRWRAADPLPSGRPSSSDDDGE
ncbi:MAG: hypothetical protein QXG03_06265 [Halalkalicoccus sp.]